MALSRSFNETVKARVERDPGFARALLGEAIQCMLEDDVETGKAVLRDYINATIGFEELARLTGKKSKSLMRMFSSEGNPQAENIFRVIHKLQERTGVHLEVRAA